MCERVLVHALECSLFRALWHVSLLMSGVCHLVIDGVVFFCVSVRVCLSVSWLFCAYQLCL